MDHGCYNGYNQIHVDDAGYVYPMLGKFYLFITTIKNIKISNN